jgi:hypothetical protein
MFHNILCIKNMIGAQQPGFLGKVVPGPHGSPALRMLTACCQHKHKHIRSYLHNKDVIVRNLQLLFAKIPKVINNNYSSVKDWFKEASLQTYWTQSFQCLLNKQAPLPTHPITWPPHADAAFETTCHTLLLTAPTPTHQVMTRDGKRVR